MKQLPELPNLIRVPELERRLFGARQTTTHDDDEQVVEDVGLRLRRALAEELLLRPHHLVGDPRKQTLTSFLAFPPVTAHARRRLQSNARPRSRHVHAAPRARVPRLEPTGGRLADAGNRSNACSACAVTQGDLDEWELDVLGDIPVRAAIGVPPLAAEAWGLDLTREADRSIEASKSVGLRRR